MRRVLIAMGDDPLNAQSSNCHCARGNLTRLHSCGQVPSRQVASTQNQRAGNPNVKVWVNTASNVYDCSDSGWYGNTKQRYYMTQKQIESVPTACESVDSVPR